MTVLLEQLSTIEPVSMTLPIPTDEGARLVAGRLLSEPGCRSTLDRLASEINLSRRTLERRFASQTGMTFREWRCQARL